MSQRVLVFGGTFDPIHLGHVAIAQELAEAVKADEILIVPTAGNPLKGGPVASPPDRLAMIQAATAELPGVAVSRVELDQSPPCYTFDTICRLRQDRPEAQFVIAMGADSLRDLPRWYEAEALLEMSEFAIACRPPWTLADLQREARGLSGLPEHLREKLARAGVATGLHDLASSTIRCRLDRGESVTHMLHPDVLAIIQQRDLYS
jgi:nicotinate-nucleotide adenylyltransferase